MSLPGPASTLPSEAERSAASAQSLQALSRFNLVGARGDLIPLLNEIGRTGIFAEYTRHDISHIDTLLEMLDWIVVPEARKAMTASDWMMVVLAIYFHDAGLIVTTDEFEARSGSDYPAFRSSILHATEATAYNAKALSLSPADQERFLYQEFVRTHHATRIKLWITNEPSDHLGISTAARSLVAKILSTLDLNFRNDLGLVCESHHSDDLADLSKYNPQRAYGSALQETANIQFASLLLRTVDLLHVTKDRAPSVSFQLATPSDPKSIEEWQKQMSVVSVRRSPPRDKSGAVDLSATADTVSISGTFNDPRGFFALNEYLLYASKELKRTHQWAETTNQREALGYAFPWRQIDSTQVQAVGFESKKFAFQLDKPKILNLLTGHTLYSNSNVVVRELIQNSLDATRLQAEESGQAGLIELHYDSTRRILTVDDNGSGMTQQIIEDHFLNVGSSRYRDENFKKVHPNFAAISRFGIGILSAFMISDDIEVYTKAATETKARNISIRNIDGQYLIRLLDPVHADVPLLIRAHGTRIQLKLRPGAGSPELEKVSRLWILFPSCTVTVQVDQEAKQAVGYSSPKQALEEALAKIGVPLATEQGGVAGKVYRVVERTTDGVDLAYLLEWDAIFKNWQFVTQERLINRERRNPELEGVIALCVQGIRVEGVSPGFSTRSVIAVSNCTAANSPATNVARSALEVSGATDSMYKTIYRFYCDQIAEEINSMNQQRGLSHSQAASEGRYLFSSLPLEAASEQNRHLRNLFNSQLKSVPWLTLDDAETRQLVTVNALEIEGGFWTVESSAFNSAEYFLRLMPNGISLAKLSALSEATVKLPAGKVLSGYSENERVLELVSSSFDIDSVRIQKESKQLNLHWRRRGKRNLWRDATAADIDGQTRLKEIFYSIARSISRYTTSITLQQSSEVLIEPPHEFVGFLSRSRIYLFAGNDLHSYLSKLLDEVLVKQRSEVSYVLSLLIAPLLLSDGERDQSVREKTLRFYRQAVSQQLNTDVSIDEELLAIVRSFQGRLFNPLLGDRLNPFSPALIFDGYEDDIPF